MSRVLSRMTLASRLLVAIALALIVSSVVADLYGAKLNSYYENRFPQGPGVSLFLGASSLTSSGRVKIVVEGATTAYYIKLSGDPFTIVQQLRALRLNVSATRPQIDLRAGVAYATALIQSNPAVVQALSALGELIPAAQAGGSKVTVEERLETGESIAMIVPTATEPSVTVRIEYVVEGYNRLSPAQASIVSIAVLAAVLLGELVLRRRSPRGAHIVA